MLNTLNLNALDHEPDSDLPTEILLGGRPTWLYPDGTTLPIIRGGDGGEPVDGDGGSDDGDADDADGADDADAGDGGDDQDPDPEDFDFPSNTPLADMTVEQQKEYWRHKAQKHENRGKAAKRAETAEVKKLRKENDDLKREKMSAGEKAVDDARREGEQKAIIAAAPKIVSAELRAAGAAKGVDLEKLTAAAELLDHSKFLDDDGDVDTDKVNAFIEGIATPDTGDNGTGKKRSTDLGQGRRQGGAGKSSVASGRDLYEERHGSKSGT